MRRYIAFDGEGETRHIPGCNRDLRPYDCHCPHYYCLLAWSLGPGQHNGYAYNPDGIPTIDALQYVWDVCRAHPKHTPVMFSAGYDFNCWLRGLDRIRAEWLWDDLPIRIGPFIVEYNRRALTLKQGRRKVDVSDTFRFYQSSFVKALEKYLPTYDALDEIRREKARRSDFDFATDLVSVLHYCLKEIEALVLLEEQRDKHLAAAGIGQTKLHGAGSIAAKLMSQHHLKQHRRVPKDDNYREVWPVAVERAAYAAYAGGRIEPWKFGYHDGTIHVYDIRSAYPRAMCDLPSLSSGHWHHHRRKRSGYSADDFSPFTLCKVRFESRTRAYGYPFFQRTSTGAILYPDAVNNWYWQPEVAAAARAQFSCEVVEAFEYFPATPETPFSFVPKLFRHRAQLKAAGENGAQEMLKLGLNSLYGKLAQTVGGDAENPPPFHQIGWAGYVTARTRAEVFTAAMQAPRDVCFIATDGVASLSELDVSIGTELGQWEHSVYDGALVIQAGVYFLWKGTDCLPKYRGFDRGGITPQTIIDAWKRGDESIHIPSTRFIGLGSALEAHWESWCSWRTIPRELDLMGGDGKREFIRRGNEQPWRQLCDLEPYTLPGVVSSVPYSPKWREMEKEKLDAVLWTTYTDEIEAEIGEEL